MLTTPEYDNSIVILKAVKDERARRLLYQAEVNLKLFNYASEQLHNELDALNFEDFARANTCHMTEGIFGELTHTAKMASHKQGVIGFLLTTVTAGHRFTRAILAARRKDQSDDWKSIKYDIKVIDGRFHKVRNFLEHMDEAIASEQNLDGIDCTFSRGGILSYKKKDESFTFDFSRTELEKPQQIYEKIIEMLKKRLEDESEKA